MVFFQIPDHKNEKGRGYKRKSGSRTDYLFQDPYTGFTKNGDGFRNVGFEKSEVGYSINNFLTAGARMVLTKAHLIERIRSNNGLTMKQSTDLLESTIALIKDTLY